MINPYFIYILTFTISLLVYQLGWATIFPHLKFPLVIFLLSSIAVSFVLGRYFQLKRFIEFIPTTYNRKIPITFYFICLLWALSFLYNRGIPLLLILRGANYDYTEFGIPTLHVFIVTFTSFFGTYLFHVYLSTRRRKVLFYYLVTMSFAILLFNRGMLLINVVSSLFVYLQYIRFLSLKKVITITAFSILILYGFGVLGNIRLVKGISPDYKYSNEPILTLAQADEDFVSGIIPQEFIWSYLYISSPLGNLQYNIDIENRLPVNGKTIFLFVNNEFVFDFISKRIDHALGTERQYCRRFADFLTVGTVFSNSYIYLGWVGVIVMGIFVLFFPIIYMGFLRKRQLFYVTATSTLASLYLFLVFDNMFAFTGLSFQLVYPFVFGFIYKQGKNSAV